MAAKPGGRPRKGRPGRVAVFKDRDEMNEWRRTRFGYVLLPIPKGGPYEFLIDKARAIDVNMADIALTCLHAMGYLPPGLTIKPTKFREPRKPLKMPAAK